jgi:hypothetical protein
MTRSGAYYVHRTHADGREGWSGPFRRYVTIRLVCQGWIDRGWRTDVQADTADIRARVRAWEFEAAEARYATTGGGR